MFRDRDDLSSLTTLCQSVLLRFLNKWVAKEIHCWVPTERLGTYKDRRGRLCQCLQLVFSIPEAPDIDAQKAYRALAERCVLFRSRTRSDCHPQFWIKLGQLAGTSKGVLPTLPDIPLLDNSRYKHSGEWILVDLQKVTKQVIESCRLAERRAAALVRLAYEDDGERSTVARAALELDPLYCAPNEEQQAVSNWTHLDPLHAALFQSRS